MTTTFPCRTDDFCVEHGYEHMRSRLGDPIPYCQACEDARVYHEEDIERLFEGKEE
jgi:hypothetical protein